MQPPKLGDNAALEEPSPTASGGKPVMNQSALHGCHVFEGLQLVIVEKEEMTPGEIIQSGSDNGTNDPNGDPDDLGFTFMEEKVKS